jgi:ribose/xylose/arabinose/galactoside ABC-type transport system permease subunit
VTAARKWLTAGQFVLALAVLLALGRLVSAEFLSAANIRNLLNQTSIVGVLALAQFMVVLIGGFDLSVAAILALGSVVVASLASHHHTWLAVTAALASGAALGTLSGVAATLGRVPPLIATLGVASIARGLAFLVAPKSVPAPHGLVASLQFTAGVFTTTTVVWLLLSVLLAWVLGRTRLGRHVYAIGGNERSARLAGIRVVAVKVGVYALAGTLSALAGVLFVIRSWSGMPHVGSGWELESIAGIVIGGTRLFGGEGHVLNAMLGMLIYQIVGNLMNLVSLDPYYQDIVKATVIVAVVGTSVLLAHRRGLRLWS